MLESVGTAGGAAMGSLECTFLELFNVYPVPQVAVFFSSFWSGWPFPVVLPLEEEEEEEEVEEEEEEEEVWRTVAPDAKLLPNICGCTGDVAGAALPTTLFGAVEAAARSEPRLLNFDNLALRLWAMA